MSRVLFAVTGLFLLFTSAYANEDNGVYLVGMVGQTTNISNVDTSISLSGLLGYRFNSVLAVEGGMALLAEKVSYITPPVGYTAGSTYSTTSISGSEAAARLSLPFSDWFSIFARFGYTHMSRTNSPSPAEVEVTWSGVTYGVGAQLMLPFDFGIAGNKVKIGFRAGVNQYNLTDSTGLLTESPKNSYVGGVISF